MEQIVDATSTSGLVPKAQFNGNISGIKWKSKAPNIDSETKPEFVYLFRYDDLNRMTAAYSSSRFSISSGFNVDVHHFDEKVTYDLSGNIKKLIRLDKSKVDDLTYTYFDQSNRLQKIEDAAPVSRELDFHEAAHDEIEYFYNASGNITRDKNKNLNTTYNFQSLPVSIQDGDNNQITYSYDATGRKLCKKENELYHYYINGIEYEGIQSAFSNGVPQPEMSPLQFITTQEGRVRHKTKYGTNLTDFVYDYFIKDHLGNVRVILTEEEVENGYYATMEIQNESIEESTFENVPTTREEKPSEYPADITYEPNEKVSLLNASNEKNIGHAKVLKVTQGDKIEFDTKYFFSDDPFVTANTPFVSNILAQLANIFILNASNNIGGSTPEKKQYWAQQTFTNNPEVTNFLTSTLSSNDPEEDANKPHAYLIWMMFNNDFKFISDASGVQRVVSPDALGDLAVFNLISPDNGYLYIFVSNESEKDVSFDNLQINHNPGTLLEENHFYPFGMLIEALSNKASGVFNEYKYQDKELQTHLSYNAEEFALRHYDPAIARWIAHDPITQFANPYLAMGNNPVNSIDPLGSLSNGAVSTGYGGYNYFVSQSQALAGQGSYHGWFAGATIPSPYSFGFAGEHNQNVAPGAIDDNNGNGYHGNWIDGTSNHIGASPFVSADGASYTSSQLIQIGQDHANYMSYLYEQKMFSNFLNNTRIEQVTISDNVLLAGISNSPSPYVVPQDDGRSLYIGYGDWQDDGENISGVSLYAHLSLSQGEDRLGGVYYLKVYMEMIT